MREVIVGSRSSDLALWQTRWVVANLERNNPDIRFNIKLIKTKGDRILDVALAKIGDQGLFTKELEIAMLDGEIDMAVHSIKDLPTAIPEGIVIAAVCERYSPADVLISSRGYSLEQLPQGARVGTSSLRRMAQLKRARPDLEFCNLRGNLPTRLTKMESDGLDAIVLAEAGVARLGLSERITDRISFQVCLPAIGQGAIGVEAREGDQETLKLLTDLDHGPSRLAVTAERAFLKRLAGGCQVPIGALGTVSGDFLTLEGVVASLDGKHFVRAELRGSSSESHMIGEGLADQLLAAGARQILDEARREFESR